MARLRDRRGDLAHEGNMVGQCLPHQLLNLRARIAHSDASREIGSVCPPFTAVPHLIYDQILSHRSSSIPAFRLTSARAPARMVALGLPATVMTRGCPGRLK